MKNSIGKPLLTVFAALVVSGCMVRGTLRGDISIPASPKRVAARVVLLEKDPPVPVEFKVTTDHTALIALQPGMSHAVRSALEGLFTDFAVGDPANPPSGADLYAAYTLSGTTLNLYVGELGKPWKYVLSGSVYRKKARGNPVLGFLQYIPPLYFLMPAAASTLAFEAKAITESGITASLNEFTAELSRSIPVDLANKAAVLQALQAGDSLAASDPAGALSAYRGAFAASGSHTALGERLRGKAVEMVLRLPSPPALPEAAREQMARGKVLVGRAASVADYKSAVESMHRALELAPGWASGHFNTAIAHEGAGEWLEAANHFAAYLALRPGASDTDEVKQKIVELKIRKEKGDLPAGTEAP